VKKKRVLECGVWCVVCGAVYRRRQTCCAALRCKAFRVGHWPLVSAELGKGREGCSSVGVGIVASDIRVQNSVRYQRRTVHV
jgi:hypothetical protein